MQSRKIGVLLGGLSSEREVSLRTGEAVLTALRDRGHDAIPIYVDHDVDVALRQEQIDVAFIALHGRWGEDGCIQGLLELLGIPYTGSDVMASALAMHKGKAKELFRLHNLPTPAYYTLTADDCADLAGVHGDFGFPCVVKPIREGSSVGVAICQLARRARARRRAARCASTTRSWSSASSPARRSRSRSSATARSAPSRSRRAPASTTTRTSTRKRRDRLLRAASPVARALPRRARPGAARAHRARLRGRDRVDMMVSDSGNEFILEVNTVPGLTPTSLLAEDRRRRRHLVRRAVRADARGRDAVDPPRPW